MSTRTLPNASMFPEIQRLPIVHFYEQAWKHTQGVLGLRSVVVPMLFRIEEIVNAFRRRESYTNTKGDIENVFLGELQKLISRDLNDAEREEAQKYLREKMQ